MLKTNSTMAWVLASRPKTLTGAAAPVIVALVAAYSRYGYISPVPAVLCLLFALLMQVDSNLVNDYFDCVRGVDTGERLGPERACSQGWITLEAMRRGITVVTFLACLTGLPLIAWGGWECIPVGMACVAFCFLYTTLFSGIALGDVLVLLFFGLVPVSYTFFFQSHGMSSITDTPLGVWMLALAQGMVTDCLLLVNNFRDRHTDASVGKKTLVTIIGAKATLWLYGSLGIVAALLAYIAIGLLGKEGGMLRFLPLLFIPHHLIVLYSMKKIGHGRELNKILGRTAQSIMLFSLLVAMALLSQK